MKATSQDASSTLARLCAAVPEVVNEGIGMFAADKTCKLWDLASGVCLHTLEADSGGVNHCCFASLLGQQGHDRVILVRFFKLLAAL